MSTYTVLNVGAATGTDNFPAAINSSGQVTGYFINSALAARAFLWEPLSGALFDRGALPGTRDSYGADINVHGQIAGWCDGPSPAAKKHAIRWEASGSLLDLEPAGGNGSQAFAINDLGEAAGSLAIPNGVIQAARWDAAGVLHQLGSLGGKSIATGINNAGQIVGMSGTPGGKPHAFLWDANQNPQMSDLNLRFGADIFEVTAFVDQYVSGAMDVGPQRHAFVADLATNTLHDLGVAIVAYDVNRRGAAVGTVGMSPADAFLFDGGVAIDLKSLVVSGSGWALQDARSINDNGWIAGMGSLSGQIHRGFVLKPSQKGGLGQAIIAAVAHILSGVVGGNGGWELTLDGRIIHVPPGNPDPIIRDAARVVREVLASLPAAELSMLLSARTADAQHQRAMLVKLSPLIERALQELEQGTPR